MKRLTVAIDIDGTLRDLDSQVEKYLEEDHPDKLDKFREIKNSTYLSLDAIFETRDEVLKWMYEEHPFMLFAMAKKLHPKVIDDLNIFHATAKDVGIDLVIASVQRNQSVSASLSWLGKWGCKVQRVEFFDTTDDKIARNFDIYVEDCPMVLEAFAGKTKVHPTNKQIIDLPRAIKIPYGFTKDIECPSLDITNGNFDDLYEILGVEKILKK